MGYGYWGGKAVMLGGGGAKVYFPSFLTSALDKKVNFTPKPLYPPVENPVRIE